MTGLALGHFIIYIKECKEHDTLNNHTFLERNSLGFTFGCVCLVNVGLTSPSFSIYSFCNLVS